MDKKTLTELRPPIRALTQDVKAVKAAFDVLHAANALKSKASAELLALAEHEFIGVVSTMKSRLEEIATVLDIDGGTNSANATTNDR